MHDFDFLEGSWRVKNRKVRDPRAGASADWIEFDSEVESRSVLGGLGNMDTYEALDLPGSGRFHGLALRLFEPATGLWRIWWASSAGNGCLDPPLTGRFVEGEGLFAGDDYLAGHPIQVRFVWSEITNVSARWEQAFSFDGGRSFAVNWVMEFSRA